MHVLHSCARQQLRRTPQELPLQRLLQAVPMQQRLLRLHGAHLPGGLREAALPRCGTTGGWMLNCESWMARPPSSPWQTHRLMMSWWMSSCQQSHGALE